MKSTVTLALNDSIDIDVLPKFHHMKDKFVPQTSGIATFLLKTTCQLIFSQSLSFIFSRFPQNSIDLLETINFNARMKVYRGYRRL